MTDPTPTPAPTPIVVSSNAQLIDSLQAAGRYVVVLLAFGTALVGFLRVKDFADLITYVQANGGSALAAASGLVAIGTMAYGVFKSGHRGAQVVALAPLVPEVVHLK